MFGRRLERVKDFASFWGRFWKGLGRVLGGFLEGFGKDFKEIRDKFGKVLEFLFGKLLGGSWEDKQ